MEVGCVYYIYFILFFSLFVRDICNQKKQTYHTGSARSNVCGKISFTRSKKSLIITTPTLVNSGQPQVNNPPEQCHSKSLSPVPIIPLVLLLLSSPSWILILRPGIQFQATPATVMNVPHIHPQTTVATVTQCTMILTRLATTTWMVSSCFSSYV